MKNVSINQFDEEKADMVAKFLFKLGISAEKFKQNPEKYIRMALNRLDKTNFGDM